MSGGCIKSNKIIKTEHAYIYIASLIQLPFLHFYMHFDDKWIFLLLHTPDYFHQLPLYTTNQTIKTSDEQRGILQHYTVNHPIQLPHPISSFSISRSHAFHQDCVYLPFGPACFIYRYLKALSEPTNTYLANISTACLHYISTQSYADWEICKGSVLY